MSVKRLSIFPGRLRCQAAAQRPEAVGRHSDGGSGGLALVSVAPPGDREVVACGSPQENNINCSYIHIKVWFHYRLG